MPYGKLVQPNPQPKRPLVFPPSKGAAVGRVAPPNAPPPLPKQHVPLTHAVTYKGKPLPALPQRKLPTLVQPNVPLPLPSRSFPLLVHLTIAQRNDLLSDDWSLAVKLGDKNPQSGERAPDPAAVHFLRSVDLVHTNVAGPKINLDDFPLILRPSLPSAYWEKVSVTLTYDQRNGLLSGEHYLHVALVGARTHAWDPLEFMLEDPNGICLALWGPLAATEARDRRRDRHDRARWLPR
jgi:hypothetical protein